MINLLFKLFISIALAAPILPLGPLNYTPMKASKKPFIWVNAKKGVTLSGSNVTQWKDLSGNGYNLAPFNTNPTYSATGMNGYPMLTFDGTQNNVGKIGIGGVTRTQFSFWGLVQPLGYANFNALWWMPTNVWVGGTNDMYLQDGSSSQALSYWQSDVGQKCNCAANSFANSTVWEISGTYDGVTAAIYANNKLLSSQAVASAQLGDRMVLGGLQPGSAGFNWHGNMSEMVFFSGPLSTTDRTNLHRYGINQWFPVWAFNTNSILFDGSTGIYTGGANDVNFDYTQPLTISAWIQPASNFAGIGKISIIGKETTDATHKGYDFLLETTKKLSFYMSHDDSVSNEVYAFSGNTVPVVDGTTWTHVAVTSDGTGTAAGIKFYINGVTATTTFTQNALSASITTSAPFYLGDAWLTTHWNGALNNISFFTAALNQSQITALYNFGCPSNLTGSANLAHWWYVGSGTDSTSTVLDRVGSVNVTGSGGLTVQNSVPLPLQ